MSQAPTPSETPMTDTLDYTCSKDGAALLSGYWAMLEFARRLERDRARLMEALREIINNPNIRPMDVENAAALLKELS